MGSARVHGEFHAPSGPERNQGLREFLDIFNHRLISFFYRAWEKYRFPIAYEREQLFVPETTDAAEAIQTWNRRDNQPGLDTFSKETVVQALETVKDVDLLGLTPPWTPSAPGFSIFESSSNHFVYISKFDGTNVVTDTEPIDVSQFAT